MLSNPIAVAPRTVTKMLVANDAPVDWKICAALGGAVQCDGADDDVQIQAAIDAGVKDIGLSPGIFSSGTKVDIHVSDVEIKGSGKGVTTLQADAAAATLVEIGNGTDKIYRCTIADMTLSGNGSSNLATACIDVKGRIDYLDLTKLRIVYAVRGIKMQKFQWTRFSFLDIYNFSTVGIDIYTTSGGYEGHSLFERCTFVYPNALGVDGAADVVIQLSGGYALIETIWLNCHFNAGTTVTNSKGVYLKTAGNGSAESMEFVSCVFENSLKGFYAENDSSAAFRGCAFYGNNVMVRALEDENWNGRYTVDNCGFYSLTCGIYNKSSNWQILGQVRVSSVTTTIQDMAKIQIANKKYESSKSVVNSGTGTVANGATSIKVAHGLVGTPTRVQITLTTSLGNASEIYVSDKDIDNDDTKFQVDVDANPGAAVSFDWRAWLGEGH